MSDQEQQQDSPGPMMSAAAMLTDIFQKYSEKQGDPTTLTKGDLKDLLQNEMKPVLENASDKAEVDKILNQCDKNKDDHVDLMEYFKFVGAVAFYFISQLSQGMGRKPGDSPGSMTSAVGTLVGVFRKYSRKVGDSNTLTKGELKDLLHNEMGCKVENASDKADMEAIFNQFDKNKDDHVDLMEYFKFVGTVAFRFIPTRSQGMGDQEQQQGPCKILGATLTLIDLFNEHAGKEGDPSTLSKKELKELLKADFGNKLKYACDLKEMDKIFSNLDSDEDGTVDFTEFMTFFAAISAITFCDK